MIDLKVMMNTETKNMRDLMIQGRKYAKILPFISEKSEKFLILYGAALLFEAALLYIACFS
jgi:hypothetical protein